MPRLETPIADIIRDLLIHFGCGSSPEFTPGDTSPWPVYVSQEPDTPDNVVTVYDTSGITEGRIHNDGVVPEQMGILVRVRSVDYVTGWAQMNKIVETADEKIYRNRVLVKGILYLVHSMTRRGAINSLGRFQQAGDREALTANFTVTLAS